MANLTPQQANDLANHFKTMGAAVGDYKRQNFDRLSKQQIQGISELHGTILNYANEMYTLSAILVIDDVEASLASISEVTNRMNSTYQTLKDIQKVINIAGAVVNLGKAIVDRNPHSILVTLSSLEDLLSS
jgi:hypothetical protein